LDNQQKGPIPPLSYWGEVRGRRGESVTKTGGGSKKEKKLVPWKVALLGGEAPL